MLNSELPLHPLIVHAAVVAVPVAALAAVIISIFATKSQRWRLPTFITATLGAIATAIAASTGEALAEAKGMSEHAPPLAEHAEYGEIAVICAGIFAGLLFLYTLAGYKPDWFKASMVVVLLRVGVIIAAIAAFATVFLAGHEGAVLVWVES